MLAAQPRARSRRSGSPGSPWCRRPGRRTTSPRCSTAQVEVPPRRREVGTGSASGTARSCAGSPRAPCRSTGTRTASASGSWTPRAAERAQLRRTRSSVTPRSSRSPAAHAQAEGGQGVGRGGAAVAVMALIPHVTPVTTANAFQAGTDPATRATAQHDVRRLAQDGQVGERVARVDDEVRRGALGEGGVPPEPLAGPPRRGPERVVGRHAEPRPSPRPRRRCCRAGSLPRRRSRRRAPRPSSYAAMIVSRWRACRSVMWSA